jgi:hypothetical protein
VGEGPGEKPTERERKKYFGRKKYLKLQKG